MYQPYGTNDFEYGRGGVDLSAFLGRTYRWMFLGLLTTFAVAFAGYWTGAVLLLFRSSFLLIGLTILQLVLVWRVSGSLHRISASSAVGSFFAYAVLNGVLFSAYFLIFDLSSMIYAFADEHQDRRLMRIAADGVIDELERPEFDAIMAELREIVRAALAVGGRKKAAGPRAVRSAEADELKTVSGISIADYMRVGKG